MFGFLSGAGSLLGGLGGLFGSKKQKQPSPRDNIMSQAQGARDAAKEYGFNPLTLLQYGQPGGASPIGGGGTPPLASIGAITDGLKDIGDVVSGDAARRRAADQLELDLAQLKLEQAQSGVVAAAPGASGVGSGPSPLGRSAVGVPTTGGATHSRKFGMSENPIAPGRERDVMELPNSPGVFEVENELTFGSPITIPGDSEPWGIDELATAAVVGIPQVGRNYVQRRRNETKEEKEKREKRRDETVFRHPPGHLGMFSRAMSLFN